MDTTTVYDLGEVDSPRAAGGAGAAAVADLPAPPTPRLSGPPTAPRIARPYAPPSRGSVVTQGRDGAGAMICDSLGVFVPGAGRLIRGDVAGGLCLLANLGFCLALAWAVLTTFDRLCATFALFGISRAAGLWALAGIYALGAAIHLASVRSVGPRSWPPHPAVSGVASAIVPGWGQALNGDRGRAMLFVALLWTVGASWLLATPQTATLLDAHGLFLPPAAATFASAGVRWTATAVLWSVAVYDAVSRSGVARRA